MYEYKLKEIIKVVDGDTIDVLIDLGFGLLKNNSKKSIQNESIQNESIQNDTIIEKPLVSSDDNSDLNEKNKEVQKESNNITEEILEKKYLKIT